MSKDVKREQQSSHRHHGHESKHNSRDHHRDERSKSEKRMNRLNSNERRSQTEDSTHGCSKSMEQRRIRKPTSNSSDDSDSDGPKKHSIFDIPDDGPAYISMYDKVKARSCKNMQKQEEEKKIKAKFSQLKESRAKREEKKQNNSYDEDTDSDMDTNEHRMKHAGKMKHFFDSSTEDSDDRHSMIKDMVSDSESNSRKGHFRINRINEICDGESSENSSLHQFQMKPRRRISSRKNSRSARITSETSDDAFECTPVKQEPLEKHDDEEMKCEIKTELVNIPKEEKQDIVQFKIKSEPVEFSFENQTPERSSNLSDGDSITPSSKASETKESMFDNLFNAEAKKRHKKNKKRQKSPSAVSTEENKPIKPEEIKVEMSNPMETMFDELKRDSGSEKKRHGKKDKKRDKSSKEQHDKSKEEKYRMKKLKKQNRLSSDASIFESQESFSTSKRGEKMEDIFGPISDDDSHISLIDVHKSAPKQSASNNVHTNKTSTQSTMHTQNENNMPESKLSNLQSEKEKHREKKREKKRKEREKQQQSISSKDDDNSVDLDAAARALEAQLLEDSEQKPEEMSFTYSSSKENTNKNTMQDTPPEKPYDDVFRFSETEDGPDSLFLSRKSENMETHRSKDKKKKKKRSKEEKRHHHHHSSHSSSFISPPTTPRLTIDTDLLDDIPPSKPSPISIDENKSSDEMKEVKSKEIKTEISQPSKHSDDKRKDSKSLIPGFGLEIDSKIYDSAVQSISSDLTENSEQEKVTIEEKPVASPESKQSDKTEEKSRVIISQEETEDAVAALLGESFGMDEADDYSFTQDPIIEETSNLQTSDGAIAEEEAEEMLKAVQSLNTEDIDLKPDTPQSDNGLQIDTDTEEQEDSNALQIDENVSNEEKSEQAKDTKKSIQKDNESSKKSNETSKSSVSAGSSNASKTVEAGCNQTANSDTAKSSCVTQSKSSHAEPHILPPIIPKLGSSDAPNDLLSIGQSTPTKTNIIQVPTISNEKPKPLSPSKCSSLLSTGSKIKSIINFNLKLQYFITMPFQFFPYRYYDTDFSDTIIANSNNYPKPDSKSRGYAANSAIASYEPVQIIIVTRCHTATSNCTTNHTAQVILNEFEPYVICCCSTDF